MNAFTPLVVLLLSVQHMQNLTPALSELPDGQHYYAEHHAEPISSELTRTRALFLQKWGRIVVGVDTLSSSRRACFKGFVEENAIVDATRVLPPYTPNAEWTYQLGEMINLSHYDRRTDAIAATDRAALDICLEVFAR